MGGLDYQVEHHLAPKLPHTVYPDRSAAGGGCAARNVSYRTHPTLTEAVRSHARWLRTMGKRPSAAESPPMG